ncbi:hypothetical protein HNR22_005079 [Micromonospora jinlongensis]|uniref:Uncharacterized protein n=1 Tax=Micromonospora jinlongensis TaxID=1287877 RepID=A0A7Y9X6I1_9ACTN|nr:hypothetical protein [Micromonospora jinlongensis]
MQSEAGKESASERIHPSESRRNPFCKQGLTNQQ